MNLNSIFDSDSKREKKFLTSLFRKGRKEYPNIIVFFDALVNKMELDANFHQRFYQEINWVFKDVHFIKYLSTSGLMQEDSILSLVSTKIRETLLPEIEDDQTLSSIVNDLFYDQKNFKNFKLIPKDRWERFFIVLFKNQDEVGLNKINRQIRNQLIETINILMDRIGGDFSDNEMMRYRPSGEYAKTPFYKLSIDIRNVIENPDNPYDALAIRQSIKNCITYSNDILMQKDNKGISLKITVKINRIIEELNRLNEVMRSLSDLKSDNGLIQFLSNATNRWPEYYSPKNWISKQISSTVYLVTFLATYHNGRTGEKYITTTAKEYSKLFLTACGGGLIVAILVYIKSWLGHLEGLSPFGHAFWYGVNYSIGFTAIYLTHMTLATKQPSMTAALIAHTLKSDNQSDKINYSEFSKLFARLSRSQFIAFQGNVIASFGLATLLFFLFRNVLGWKIISVSEALKYKDELAYFDPKILWFASIAGFFLFVSGMISGLVINNQRYINATARIYHHPFLKKFFDNYRREKIANWFQRNYGGVVGNVAFGFMMGSAFLVGDFLNIHFDIRHITFVAGNLAMGLAGTSYGGLSLITLLTAIAATFAVGAFNFLVSFTLSLILAMRSNNIRLYTLFPMFWAVTKEFFRNPYKFFFPPLK